MNRWLYPFAGCVVGVTLGVCILPPWKDKPKQEDYRNAILTLTGTIRVDEVRGYILTFEVSGVEWTLCTDNRIMADRFENFAARNLRVNVTGGIIIKLRNHLNVAFCSPVDRKEEYE